jgi:hypothetical protein
MVISVASLVSALRPDPWRQNVDFTDDIQEVHTVLFESANETQYPMLLAEWLRKYQPCVFGRLAARFGAITYCLLTEADLKSTDIHIKEKIQTARLSWTRDTFLGRKSGFVIWLISPTIAFAEPSDAMMKLASRVCELYLEHEVKADQIYLEEVFMAGPPSTWRYGILHKLRWPSCDIYHY